MKATINGETRDLPEELTVGRLLEMLGAPKTGIAVACNDRVVRRNEYDRALLREGDRVEIIKAAAGGVGGTKMDSDILRIGRYEIGSRLIVGTGKYPSVDVMQSAHAASGAAMVTVAIRRIGLDDAEGKTLLDYIDRQRYLILPNTAGCYSAKEAVITAQLARELLDTDLIKLEVIGDAQTLHPDTRETLAAAEKLVAEGFTVLPYVGDDPIACRQLEELGCAAVMPLAAPIGSGLGVCNPYSIRIIKERAGIPVIVDAGVGTASDAAIAMELGIDALLMNTGIAGARDPVLMATAMKHAVLAGRQAFLAGRIEKRLYAAASSPMQDLISTR